MNNHDEVIVELTARITDEITKKYRISFDTASTMVYAALMSKRSLNEIISSAKTIEAVERTREFKNAYKEIKKQIYYMLRKYHREKEAEIKLIEEFEDKIQRKADINEIYKIRDALLTKHSSTAERFDYYSLFYYNLFKIISPPKNILDIACGLHPLSYPFDRHKPEIYVAIERNKACSIVIEIFAKMEIANCIKAVNVDLNDLEWKAPPISNKKFEFAFMLKLVPFITRFDKSLLQKLAETPAKQILITGNEQALAKKQTISRREDNTIKRFIKLSGRKIVADFHIPGEFGYLVE